MNVEKTKKLFNERSIDKYDDVISIVNNMVTFYEKYDVNKIIELGKS